MKALERGPRLRVRVGLETLSGASASLVSAVQVRTHLGLPAQCLLDLDLDLLTNSDLADRAVGGALRVAPGDRLLVEVEEQALPLFVGEVTAVEHVFCADRSRLQRVHAYDALHALRQRQQVRVLEGLTVRGLAEALSEGAGLLVEGPEGPALPRTYQHRQSDLELLREQAEACGLYAVVEDGAVLRLVDLTGTGDPVELVWGASLHSAQVEVGTASGVRGVRAERWDADTASTGSVVATGATPRELPLDGSGGADVGPTVDEPGGGRERLLVDVRADDDALPTAWAQAVLDTALSETVCADLVAEGDVRLRAGARVRLRELGDELDGVHVLTEVTHILDEAGWVVTATTRPPAPLRTAAGAGHATGGATLAVVTDVDDAAGRGRVRVRCPAYGDLETAWLPVVTPGAGAGRGLVVPPDVGDPVVLLVADDDLDHCLVLGGLYGSATPRDTGVVDGRTARFGLSTAGGQVVALEDDRGCLRLENAAGSVLELGPELLLLHAATDLVLEAPGHTVTVRAKAVRFEEAS